MKVKNIAFSGFMAAILMGAAGSANAAISVASQGYVDSKVGAVATTVNDYKTEVANTYLTQEDAEESYATKDMISGEGGVMSVVDSLNDSFINLDGLVQDLSNVDTQLQSQIEAEATARATADTQLQVAIGNVYTKTEADAKFEEQAEATKKLQESKDYTDSQIKTLTESLGGVGEDGESTGLTGTVVAQGVRIGALEDKVGATSVADQIAGALTTAQGYADAAEQNAKDYADSLADNYDAAGAADDALTAAKAYTDELANGAVKTNTEAIAGINAELETMATSETVTELTTRVGAAETDIDALQAKDTELSGAIAANAQGVAANKSAIEQIEDAYIAKPAACQNTYCVLSVNGENISWMPLTEPVADYLN